MSQSPAGASDGGLPGEGCNRETRWRGGCESLTGTAGVGDCVGKEQDPERPSTVGVPWWSLWAGR